MGPVNVDLIWISIAFLCGFAVLQVGLPPLIGFIGAGSIMHREQGIVGGLTTAASIWVVAAIGMAAGAGMYIIAAVTTVLILVVLLALKRFEEKRGIH